MLAFIDASSARHRRGIQFQAMLHGLTTEDVSPTSVLVTFREPERVLAVVKAAGGRVRNVEAQKHDGKTVTTSVELTKEEIHAKG